MISETELIYKKILSCWLVFSLVIGPVIFLVGSYLPFPHPIETPVQTGCAL